MYQIYKIVNLKNNTVAYIGSTSQSLERRLSEHRSKKGREMYAFLQRLRNEDVEIRCIDSAESKTEAYEKEEFWTRYFQEKGAPLLNKAYGKAWSDESRAKLSAACKGRIISEETACKISVANKGKLVGSRNPMFGKHHSLETKKKMSEAHLKNPYSHWKGKYGFFNARTRHAVRCVETGAIFAGVGEAERQTGVSHSGIVNCCNGKAMSAGRLNGQKLHWEYISPHCKEGVN